MEKEQQAYKNTDRMIYRQPVTKDSEGGNDSGMEPRVFVTESGAIGFNHYGTCAVKPIKEWVRVALDEPVGKEVSYHLILKELEKKFHKDPDCGGKDGCGVNQTLSDLKTTLTGLMEKDGK